MKTLSVMRRQIHSSQGQSMVEFALIIIVLVLMLMGIFDLGRVIYYNFVLNNTVHEAARAAIICGGVSTTNCSTTDATAKSNAVATTVGVPITTSDISISPSSRAHGSTVTVTATTSFTPITPFIARIIGGSGSITMNARSQMVVQ